jgi:hypothetical protein
VPTRGVQGDQVGFLARAELGALPRSRPLTRATFMPLPGAHPDQIGLELGDHGQGLEQQPPDRVGRIVDRAAEVELDRAGGELVGDGPRVGHRPGEPVELGHHQGVPAPAGGQRLAQPGPVPVRAGQAMVDVDPLRGDAERGQRVALGGEVLLIGGDPA